MHNLLKVLLLGTMLMPMSAFALTEAEALAQLHDSMDMASAAGADDATAHSIALTTESGFKSAVESQTAPITSDLDSLATKLMGDGMSYEDALAKAQTMMRDSTGATGVSGASTAGAAGSKGGVDASAVNMGSVTSPASDSANMAQLNSVATDGGEAQMAAAAAMEKEGVESITPMGDGQYGVTFNDGHSEIMSASELDKEFGEGASDLAKEATSASDPASNGAKAADNVGEKTVSWNVGQYVLVIMEALKDQEIDDATKEVTVKGAEQMQQSQGSPSPGASTSPATDDTGTPMGATTIGGAASALIQLLEKGKIDLSLLSEEFEESEATTPSGALGLGRVASQSGSVEDFSQSSIDNSSQTENTSNGLTTAQQRELNHRRNLLLAEWAVAATQIGEGSNAISAAFYERASGFSSAASAAQGSLGGISTITDTDRFVLFELTRAAALSAIQLGLQGAVNLNDIGLPESSSSPSDSSSGEGALNLGDVSSQ